MAGYISRDSSSLDLTSGAAVSATSTSEQWEGSDHHPKLAPISEIEDAKCECCGMCEECTPEFIKRSSARQKQFVRKWRKMEAMKKKP
uniref:Uncharacterized protein n=1 Tax=Salix viminalis TaxID=40686 RepID=A0A6N2NF98_SALVM